MIFSNKQNIFQKWWRTWKLKCKFGKNVKVLMPSNIYGCQLNDNVFVGPFVEIQNDVVVGNNTRISSGTFICSGVTIGENCFVGHGVMFTNDMLNDNDESGRWVLRKTHIGDKVKIGSNASILPVIIGDNCIIGAGAVITKDVPANHTAVGVPAKFYPTKGVR
jgi:acetyltransferase-like isoleucine patch superfamily enzyme